MPFRSAGSRHAFRWLEATKRLLAFRKGSTHFREMETGNVFLRAGMPSGRRTVPFSNASPLDQVVIQRADKMGECGVALEGGLLC